MRMLMHECLEASADKDVGRHAQIYITCIYIYIYIIVQSCCMIHATKYMHILYICTIILYIECMFMCPGATYV